MSPEAADLLTTDLVKRVEVVTMWHGIQMGPASVSDVESFMGDPDVWSIWRYSKVQRAKRFPETAEYDPCRMTLVLFTQRR